MDRFFCSRINGGLDFTRIVNGPVSAPAETFFKIKVGRVVPIAIVSILPHAEFEPNDHREDASHYIKGEILFKRYGGNFKFK